MDICASLFTIYKSQKVEEVQFSISKQMDEYHMVCTV